MDASENNTEKKHILKSIEKGGVSEAARPLEELDDSHLLAVIRSVPGQVKEASELLMGRYIEGAKGAGNKTFTPRRHALITIREQLRQLPKDERREATRLLWYCRKKLAAQRRLHPKTTQNGQ